LMEERNISLPKSMPKDMYMHELLSACRSSVEERLMDRMLIASIVECRGAERFKLVADNIKDAGLQKFYKTLWTSEAKHGNIFVVLALKYWPEKEVYARLNALNNIEGSICAALPIRPVLH